DAIQLPLDVLYGLSVIATPNRHAALCEHVACRRGFREIPLSARADGVATADFADTASDRTDTSTNLHLLASQHDGARRDAGRAGDERRLAAGHLVHRRAADLADAFEDQIEAVHVGFRQAAARRQHRERAAELDAAGLGERAALPALAEA